MMNVKSTRDPEMEEELLDAFNSWSSDRPRTLQRKLGPSSLGGCREYIRATIAGDEGIAERPRGLDAASIGTMVGDSLESIFEGRIGVATQVHVSIQLAKLGLTVEGHSDMLWIERQRLFDLKSKNGLAEIEREGASLENVIQISVYTVGAVQNGTLPEGSSASLVYYDRSGTDKKFLIYTFTWEELLGYVEIAESRLAQVFEVLDAGSPDESRWGLRDKEPGMCFYTQCEFRLNCWGGADNWIPASTITTEAGLAAVAEYVRARKAAKDGVAYQREAREGLRGVEGVTSVPIDGLVYAVSWKPGRNDDRLDVIPM